MITAAVIEHTSSTPWWAWVIIGTMTWFAISFIAGLLIGPMIETPDDDELPR